MTVDCEGRQLWVPFVRIACPLRLHDYAAIIYPYYISVYAKIQSSHYLKSVRQVGMN